MVRQVHEWTSARVGSLAWLNLLLGVALGVYTGILLSALGARPAWNSALLGPLFLVSGISTGAALMLLLPTLGHSAAAAEPAAKTKKALFIGIDGIRFDALKAANDTAQSRSPSPTPPGQRHNARNTAHDR